MLIRRRFRFRLRFGFGFGFEFKFSLGARCLRNSRQDDDVAEWRHGRPWLPEQSMDEADGHRSQGATPHGQRPESVRFQ